MKRELGKKLEEAAKLGVSTSSIENITDFCGEQARKSPSNLQKEEFLACTIHEVDKLEEKLIDLRRISKKGK